MVNLLQRGWKQRFASLASKKKLECIEQLNNFFFRGEGGCHSLTLKSTSNRESLDYHRKYLQNVRTKYLVIGLFGITQVFECRK